MGGKKPGDFAAPDDPVLALANTGFAVPVPEPVEPKIENKILVYGNLDARHSDYRYKNQRFRTEYVDFLEGHIEGENNFTAALDYILGEGIEKLKEQLATGDVNMLIKK